jgi:hypothetical protein
MEWKTLMPLKTACGALHQTTETLLTAIRRSGLNVRAGRTTDNALSVTPPIVSKILQNVFLTMAGIAIVA